MFVTPGIEKQLFAILRAERWDLLKPFFATWETEEEMIDKVLLWGHFFLDHYFRNASPDFHRDLIKRFFSNKNEYTAAPRGFSKTTILQTCCDFSVVNKLDRFIVVVEKTFTEAAEVIKGVHAEFLDNEKIIAVYGQLVNKSWDTAIGLAAMRNKEAVGDVVINGVRLRGKGFNSNIRGLKTRQWRPTRIIMDDVEEDAHINNPEQRRKYENNYNKGIQPAVDIDGTIKVYGTILHQDSLLKNLIDNHGGKIYQAHEGDDPATAPDSSFLWPARWSREKLIAKRKDMMSAGQSSSAYMQEYNNNPISNEDRTFKFHWLWEMIQKPNAPEGEVYRVPAQRVTMAQFEQLRKKTTMNGYAMIDTADSTKSGSDWIGALVVFVDTHGNRYRVDVRREKHNILGVITMIFDIWEKWAPYGLIKIGVEKKGYDDQIVPLFEEEKRRRVSYPIIEELKPGGRNKEGRIKGALQGFYETGKMISLVRVDENGIIHAIGDTDFLLEELYDFPSAKHDDLSDAEAYEADLVVVPLQDEDKAGPSREPENDPFNNSNEVKRYDHAVNSHVGGFEGGEDPSDIYD